MEFTRSGGKRRAAAPLDEPETRPAQKRKTRRSPDNESVQREQAKPTPSSPLVSLQGKSAEPTLLPPLMRLPNETLVQLVGCLPEEQDLWAAALVNRRMAVVFSKPLGAKLCDEDYRLEKALLWAVDAGRHDFMRRLLDDKTKYVPRPGFLYKSFVLRSRLLDILHAQGRRGTATPRHGDDKKLSVEMLREKFCRDVQTRQFVQALRNGREDSLEKDLDWIVGNPSYMSSKYSLADSYNPSTDFGVVEDDTDPKTRNSWAWSSLHLAAYRGDCEAIKLLLRGRLTPESEDDQNFFDGAHVDLLCSGFCDCSAPELVPNDPDCSVAPDRYRLFWTPLHVAMCSGHREAAKLLIANGASCMVSTLVPYPGALSRKHRVNITAFQSAACIGSVEMCELLFDVDRFKKWRTWGGIRLETPLQLAAAAGHCKTVGEVLLNMTKQLIPRRYDNPGLNHRPTHFAPDPVTLLCMQHEYDDADWLIDRCQPLTHFTSGVNEKHYSRMLAALCLLCPAVLYNSRSLRAQQDHLFSLASPIPSDPTADEMTHGDIRSNLSKRLHLAAKLLTLGANPYRAVFIVFPTSPRYGSRPQHVRSEGHTPLQLAARNGFTQMVQLLLGHGAPPRYLGDRSVKIPELPLFLAVKQALTPGGNLDTVRVLLASGVVLADRNGKSMLSALYGYLAWKDRLALPDRASADWTNWLNIVDLFLEHGAADSARGGAWGRTVVQACQPGNLDYCLKLEKARPITGLPSSFIAQMLERTVRSCRAAKRADGSTHDIDLVRWVLGHCQDKGGLRAALAARIGELRQQVATLRQAGKPRHSRINDVSYKAEVLDELRASVE